VIKKFQDLVSENYNLLLMAKNIQQFSKYSPCELTHCFQRSCHYWKHFWKESFGMVFSVLVAFFLIASMSSNPFPFNTVFNWGNNQKSQEPCQGSTVVAERQECHDLPKIPGWNVLCVLVHCRDVTPRHPPPVSVASCEKQPVSDVSELVDKTVGLQFGLVERTHNEQYPPYQRKH